jgi:UDP-N-acetylmuramoyl-L-alanyl-D-glutamate--2,6-diaminopimelate ligase
MSTIGNKIHNQDVVSTHTTPDPIQLNKLLARMVDAGCTYCFMEVSSHAIEQHRIAGLEFTGGVFTNITHDHLDYHKTFDNYITAKKKFFDGLTSEAFSLVNNDDFHAEIMLQNTNSKQYTFAVRSLADFRCKVLENHFDGLVLSIDGSEVYTQLVGTFNAYNLLTVYAVAKLLKQNELEILTDITKLKPVEGRFSFVKSTNDIVAVVDYAHTPDALKNVLDTINDIRGGQGRLITVVGCGGDRDKEKRPTMAKIACKRSDKVVFTSDNPRTEDQQTILQEMEKGVEPEDYSKTLAIENRKQAIKAAVSYATPGDIILIAGKGHEKYQEINGVKHPFNDMQEIINLFEITT